MLFAVNKLYLLGLYMGRKIGRVIIDIRINLDARLF